MNKLLSFSLAISLLLSISGCMDHEKMIKKFLPNHIDSFAKESIELAKRKDIDGILSRINESTKNAQLEGTFSKLFAYMDKGEVVSIIATAVHLNKFNENTTYNLTYQIQYPEAYQLVNIVLFENSNGISIKGFHVNDIPDSLDVLNKFTFTGKSFKHFLFFTLTVSYIFIIVTAFIVCLRTKNLKGKWPWAILTILGVGEFLFNWTTGAWEIKPLSFGFKISIFVQPTPDMPPILAFYFPLGAILFFVKKATLGKARKTIENNEESLTNQSS
jgi:hypothetical protein